MPDMKVHKKIKRAAVHAVVTRKDGRKEDLGEIASTDALPEDEKSLLRRTFNFFTKNKKL